MAKDWPECDFYKELLEQYPDAKVVLSLRKPDRWYESCRDTIFQSVDLRKTLLGRLLTIADKNVRDYGVLADQLYSYNFGSRLDDQKVCTSRFEEHIAEVKELVDSKQLLLFSVKDGWGPLCQFLETPVPDEPFPYTNSTEMFKQRLRKYHVANNVLFYGLLGLIVLIASFIIAHLTDIR